MISIKELKKVYDNETIIALKDFQFDLGKSYCILGPSGSGKSTLLNMIAGIVKPTKGEIDVNGINISSLSQQELDKYRYQMIGYISQDFKLFDDFSVMDNLELVGVGGKFTFPPREVLEWVGLGHKLKSKVKTLSGGEKQRVAIARALLKSPKVMLCDEPTGSLNTTKSVEIIELLVMLHKKHNNTLITVTHDDRMVKYFDEVVRFDELLINSDLQEVTL